MIKAGICCYSSNILKGLQFHWWSHKLSSSYRPCWQLLELLWPQYCIQVPFLCWTPPSHDNINGFSRGVPVSACSSDAQQGKRANKKAKRRGRQKACTCSLHQVSRSKFCETALLDLVVNEKWNNVFCKLLKGACKVSRFDTECIQKALRAYMTWQCQSYLSGFVCKLWTRLLSLLGFWHEDSPYFAPTMVAQWSAPYRLVCPLWVPWVKAWCLSNICGLDSRLACSSWSYHMLRKLLAEGQHLPCHIPSWFIPARVQDVHWVFQSCHAFLTYRVAKTHIDKTIIDQHK